MPNRSINRLCLIGVSFAGAALLMWGCRARPQPQETKPVAAAPAPVPLPSPSPPPPPPPPPPFRHVVFPTDQQGLLDTNRAGVFQPTAAGNPESPLFGTVRMANRGRRVLPSFHEGIDIAPTQRDRHGLPLDAVHAVAAGSVGYISRAPGNSNYGIYVVLLHPDPVGPIYTLYAHLAQVAGGLQPGQPVQASQIIGTMGHTPPAIIPRERAHTHFEIGVIANAGFDRWFRSQRLKPDHGIYNGWNLLGTDPLAFFRHQRDIPDFDFGKHLARIPHAFEILVVSALPLDYFHRYPSLWTTPQFHGGGLVITCSENGVPLAGRQATDAEMQALGKAKTAVLSVDEKVLGHNGCRLIVRSGSAWKLGEAGQRWMRILTYAP